MTDETPSRLLSAAQVSQLIDTNFPQANGDSRLITVEQVDQGGAVLRLKHDARNMRHGGTISGPAMFTLADVSIYALVLAHIGEPGLQSVTTSLNINFLSRPHPGDLIAKARLIKLGRRLAVGQVELFSEGNPACVAHATGTYAIPPKHVVDNYHK